eukprot:1155861-Pelagomonas_calceolata.AAC.1
MPRYRGSDLEEWQGPLLNDHRGKVGVVLAVTALGGGRRFLLAFFLNRVNPTIYLCYVKIITRPGEHSGRPWKFHACICAEDHHADEHVDR